MANNNMIDLSPLFFEESRIPATLYHYTSISSFIEIMKAQACFYATHYSFLNDGFEIAYGKNLFDSFLERIYPNLFFEYFAKLKEDVNKNAWFITSFSEVDDDLGQWRAYTDKINGGVSIGFKSNEILKKISYDIFYSSDIALHEKMANFFLNQKPVNILKCMYKQDEIENFLQKEIQWIDTDFKTNMTRPDSIDKNTLYDAYLGNLTDLRLLTASFAKNSSFSLEKEWRIVLWKDFTNEPLIFLAGKPRIKAFELDHKAMIDSITISPHGNQKLNYKLAEILCAALHISPVIRVSESSYIG